MQHPAQHPQAVRTDRLDLLSCTVYLGRLGGFGYFGDPATGYVASIAVTEGRRSTGFGDRYYFRGHRVRAGGLDELTAEGARW